MGDCLEITELGVTLIYRVIQIDEFGIHVELLNKPWLKYVLVKSQSGWTLYQNLGPVQAHPLVIPPYNPEHFEYLQQDEPI